MANRQIKTWAEVKVLRPLSSEAQAANATWVEQQIVDLNFRTPRQQLGEAPTPWKARRRRWTKP